MSCDLLQQKIDEQPKLLENYNVEHQKNRQKELCKNMMSMLDSNITNATQLKENIKDIKVAYSQLVKCFSRMVTIIENKPEEDVKKEKNID